MADVMLLTFFSKSKNIGHWAGTYCAYQSAVRAGRYATYLAIEKS